MWDVLTALIAAIAPVIIPLVIIWLVVTHWQEINAYLHDLATIPSQAILPVAAGLTNEALIFVGGLGLIGLVFFAGERKIEPKAPPPVFAPIGPAGFGPIAGQAGAAARVAPYQFANPGTYTSAFPTFRTVFSSRKPLPVPSGRRRSG